MKQCEAIPLEASHNRYNLYKLKFTFLINLFLLTHSALENEREVPV